jgi:hypothetical protein
MPAGVSWSDRVHVAWTGIDRHVNLLTLDSDRQGKPVWLAKSSAAPAVCSHDGQLVLGWAGSHARLNVARLR